LSIGRKAGSRGSGNLNPIAHCHWLTNIEQSISGLLDRIEKETHAKVIVIGTAIGGYFAALLAFVKTCNVRATVLVDALVNSPMRSRANPDQPATIDERDSLF